MLRHEILDADGFLTSDSVCDHWKCINIVFSAFNEPSFDKIGKKLTSVDQKVLSIMVLSFSDNDLFISLFFSKPIHGYVEIFGDFLTPTPLESHKTSLIRT